MTPADGLLLLDKPAGFSSTQALARAKRALGAPKAGHTGTLDPFATGLLPLAFGEATKFSRFLVDATKSYLATLALGFVSDTGDTEGEARPTGRPIPGEARIDEVLRAYLGEHDQVPPMHSAVHVGGKRLYQLAREGLEVARPSRRVAILELERRELDGARLVVAVTCSKGTYIRTLAMDIGSALGCGAYLTALRRTAVGGFDLSQAVPLEVLQAEGPEAARARLLPLEVLVRGLPRHAAGPEAARRFTQGQELDWAAAAPGTEYAVYGPDGAFLGVAGCGRPGRLAPLRLMATAGGAKSPDFS